ncbi:acyltransferase [Caminibacter profundus]
MIKLLNVLLHFSEYWQILKYRYLYNIFFFKKIFLKKYGHNVFIHPLVSIKNPKKIVIGNNVLIHRNCVLWCELDIGNNVQINPNTVIYGKVIIGNNVMIAPNCMIASGNHGIKMSGIPMIDQECTTKGPIIIEDDVWIGANSVILDGVKVSKGCVIAAGSVVVKSTKEYGIYAGVPAKLIKKRTT